MSNSYVENVNRRQRKLKNIYIERSRHGRRAVYYRVGKNRRVRLPDDMSSEAFRAAYQAACCSEPIPSANELPPSRQKVEATLKTAIRAAASRARQKGVPFDLSLDHILGMAAAQDFRCSLTGIRFFAAHSSKGRVHPYLPSIDRIGPKLGYTPGNVRLVIYAVNAMLLDWGEECFLRVVNSYKRHRSAAARSRAS